MDYMSTNFGADSSSCFPFRVQTNRQTDVTEHLTHAGGYAGVGDDLGNRHQSGMVAGQYWTLI